MSILKNDIMNLFTKVDMVKHAGKTIAINADTGDLIATAKEKRSLKYDKKIYGNVIILSLPGNPTPEVKKEKLLNRIAIVLDESGSMSSIKSKTIEVFNKLVENIEREAKTSGQETTISLYTFNDFVRNKYNNQKDVEKLSSLNYFTSGSTALLDAIGQAIEDFKYNNNDKGNVSYLIYVLTDGYENASRKYTPTTLSFILDKCNNEKNYTITIQLPHGSKKAFCDKYPVFSDNVREWEVTEKGMEDVGCVTTSAFSNFYRARASGARAVSNFYVNTDLSQVKQSDLNKLEDISGKVKIVEVPKECVIKDFVESKTKRPYVIGQGYYQLMKKELVQHQKSVAIYDKKSKMVYGGKQARRLIGLAEGINCKVNPLDHGPFDIFLQSTSVNRKLPSGTKVLIDINKLTNDKPTWE